MELMQPFSLNSCVVTKAIVVLLKELELYFQYVFTAYVTHP